MATRSEYLEGVVVLEQELDGQVGLAAACAGPGQLVAEEASVSVGTLIATALSGWGLHLPSSCLLGSPRGSRDHDHLHGAGSTHGRASHDLQCAAALHCLGKDLCLPRVRCEASGPVWTGPADSETVPAAGPGDQPQVRKVEH